MITMPTDRIAMPKNDPFTYARIEQAIQYLTTHFIEQPTLEEMAEESHLSPHHFQRVFAEWAGISPKKFLQYLTTEYLKEKLRTTSNLIEAAETAGLSSQSRVYDHFMTLEAVTPHQYKEYGKAAVLRYGYHPTPFGVCFIAATERGITSFAFVNDVQEHRDRDFAHFQKQWCNANIQHDSAYTADIVQHIFAPIHAQHSSRKKFHLLVQGTNFQVKVWQALLAIPQGSLTSYQHIADAIGNPKAVRAVGSAVGDNPIAYLIPCHRVIRKEGVLGQYRWGAPRKKALVGWEMAHSQVQENQ